MSFRYVNPGYGAFLTPYDSSYPISTVESGVYARNGVAISQSSSYAEIKLDEALGTDLYGKFDFYYDSDMTRFRIGSFIDTSSDNWSWFCGFGGYSGNALYFFMQPNRTNTGKNFIANAINSVWFHIYNTGTSSSSDYDSFFELIVNDDEKVQQSFNYARVFNQSYKSLEIRLGNGMYISNLILSDEYISPKEEVIILPTSGVVTDMTDNQDGTYTADEAGQTILQTVDATSLITQYGGKSKVTSIGSIGVPAYKTATGLSNLVGIDKISGTITDHNSIALSTNSTLGAIDVWNTNITIEALNGKQIGWKAAT